jgi:hypothetical protein
MLKKEKKQQGKVETMSEFGVLAVYLQVVALREFRLLLALPETV